MGLAQKVEGLAQKVDYTFDSTFSKGRRFGSTFSKVDKVENNIL